MNSNRSVGGQTLERSGSRKMKLLIGRKAASVKSPISNHGAGIAVDPRRLSRMLGSSTSQCAGEKGGGVQQVPSNASNQEHMYRFSFHKIGSARNDQTLVNPTLGVPDVSRFSRCHFGAVSKGHTIQASTKVSVPVKSLSGHQVSLCLERMGVPCQRALRSASGRY